MGFVAREGLYHVFKSMIDTADIVADMLINVSSLWWSVLSLSDLKPQNLLISEIGELKLADFGKSILVTECRKLSSLLVTVDCIDALELIV